MSPLLLAFGIFLLLAFLLATHFLVAKGRYHLGIIQNPMFWVSLAYLINYPARVIVLFFFEQQNEVYALDEFEIAIAGLYSFFFYIVFCLTFNVVVRENSPYEIKFSWQESDRKSIYLAIALYVSSFLFKYLVLKKFSMAVEGEILQDSFQNNLFSIFDALRWVLLPVLAYCWVKFRTSRDLFLLCFIVFVTMLDAFIQTSKGQMLSILIAVMFGASYAGMKGIRLQFVIPIFFVFLVFAYFTYLVRYYGNVRGELIWLDYLDGLVNAVDYIGDASADDYATSSLLTRLNLLDAACVAFRFNVGEGGGWFSFGSFAELLGIIPRLFWADRPLLNYNIFVGQEVWGYTGVLAEVPIGRVGESIVALGYFGILFAVMNGAIVGAIVRVVSGRMGVMWVGYYFFLIIYVVMPESHVVYGFKMVIFILIYHLTFGAIFRVTQRTSSRARFV